MNSKDHWKTVSTAAGARPPRAGEPAEMPFGFETRVLARLRAVRELPAETWFKLAWRAVPVGVVILAVCWFSLRPTPSVLNAEEARLADAVAEEAWPP